MKNANDIARERAQKLTASLTQEEKLGLLTTHQHEIKRIGLGEFYIGAEAARGFVGRSPEKYSTVFPEPTGLAGTFDTELMERLGEIAADEFRAYYNEEKKGGLCVWGPTVDMERDPRWGRNEEAYGEDVCLAGEMTRAYTTGLAGDNGKYCKTVPTLKHFCANNNEQDRVSCNAFLPLRLKYEYYYAAFMNAIKYGGARSVMASYNEINTVPAMLNPELDTVLKKQWGMWFTVTDGGDFSQTVSEHRYFERHSETFAAAVKAGCDIMTDSDILVRKAAEKALERGLVTWEEIDRSVENVLYARIRLGQLDSDCPYDSITKDVLESESSAGTCLRAAKEQIVLLKNDGILPLKKPSKLAVVGALADESLMDWYTGYYRGAVSVLEGVKREFPDCEVIYDSLWDRVAVMAPNGKYLSVHSDGTVCADADCAGEAETFELQDWGENWKNLFSVKYKKYVRMSDDSTLKLHNRTIYDWFTRETFNFFAWEDGVLIEEYLTHKRLCCKDGGSLSFTASRTVSGDVVFRTVTLSAARERAGSFAGECDAVIYCVGNYPVQTAKECYDRRTLSLNVQEGFAQYLGSLNKNTVTVLISGYPYAIGKEAQASAAVIYTTHAGAHTGTAAAMTLSGRNNPAGRLAMTWYRSELELPDIKDYDIEKNGVTYMYFKGKPLFAFGFGLSYSRFEYKELKVSRTETGVCADVTVENVSDTDGGEVVQLYFTVTDSKVTRPIRKLCAFRRVSVPAHGKAVVRLGVPEHILTIYDTHSGRMLLESGTYRFTAGGSSDALPLSAELRLSGEEIPERSDCFSAQSYDSGKAVSIAYSKRLKEYYLRASGWKAEAGYTGVRFDGKTKITFTAGSVGMPGKLGVTVQGREYELDIPASAACDDLSCITLELPEELRGTGTLTISFSENTSVKDIRLS